MHVEDERHYVFDCPSFDDMRMRHSRLFYDSRGVLPGFDRAFRNPGAAPCQGLDAEGAFPLVSCNVVHNVLVDS